MRFNRIVLAVVITVLGSIGLATSASAHTDLVSTSPAQDSTIEVAPSNISITFSEPPIKEGAAIVLADVAGTEFEVGELTFEGATISVSSPADLPAGEYVVTWRISAEDGHALTGEFGFTFNGDLEVVAVDASSSALEQVETAGQESNTNTWAILLASFVASATIGTIYATKKRK